MALKKRNKVDAATSTSSMTDIIFLLLLFFMIASTMSSPNDMKVNLPQSHSKSATKASLVRVGITEEGEYTIAEAGGKPESILLEDLEPRLQSIQAQDSLTYVALYADEMVPYKEIVNILDIANQNRLRLVVATKPSSRR